MCEKVMGRRAKQQECSYLPSRCPAGTFHDCGPVTSRPTSGRFERFNAVTDGDSTASGCMLPQKNRAHGADLIEGALDYLDKSTGHSDNCSQKGGWKARSPRSSRREEAGR